MQHEHDPQQHAPHDHRQPRPPAGGERPEVRARLDQRADDVGEHDRAEVQGGEPRARPEESADAADRRALYIPAGCAHGFLTLADDTEVLYQLGAFFEPGAGRGFRWDDPACDLAWPEPPAVISDRDASWPLLEALPQL